jgi:hypothetical protein
VRIPRGGGEDLDVDFWILTFARAAARDTFRKLGGVKVVQSLMAGVD